MALTVQSAEAVIESRVGGFIAQVHEITEDSSKPSIQESLSWSLRKLGYTVADVREVTDTEIALVATADTDAFLDLAELRTLKSLPGNLPAIDTTVGPQSVKLSNLLPALEAVIGRRAKEIESEHGARISGSSMRRARILHP